jgi:hypothetical protein
VGVGSIEDAAEENLVVINIMDMIKKTIGSKTKVGERIGVGTTCYKQLRSDGVCDTNLTK